jgi:hypothetical protein
MTHSSFSVDECRNYKFCTLVKKTTHFHKTSKYDVIQSVEFSTFLKHLSLIFIIVEAATLSLLSQALLQYDVIGKLRCSIVRCKYERLRNMAQVKDGNFGKVIQGTRRNGVLLAYSGYMYSHGQKFRDAIIFSNKLPYLLKKIFL